MSSLNKLIKLANRFERKLAQEGESQGVTLTAEEIKTLINSFKIVKRVTDQLLMEATKNFPPFVREAVRQLKETSDFILSQLENLSQIDWSKIKENIGKIEDFVNAIEGIEIFLPKEIKDSIDPAIKIIKDIIKKIKS